MPGTSASSTIRPAETSRALGWPRICAPMSAPRLPPSSSEATRVTMMPAAVEMMSAGICATSPSPMVKMV